MKGLNPSFITPGNNRTRLRSSRSPPAPEEPLLWPSAETSHFRAVIRALLLGGGGGRHCAIVVEFQHNELAEDLTQLAWLSAGQSPNRPQRDSWTHTLWHDRIDWGCPAAY